MQRSLTRFGLGVAALAMACATCRAASTASVSGIVRNAQGQAQVGAMVQVLTGSSVAIATAFTDLYGRYHIVNLAPGSYQVRATAALFLPTTRWNLRLATGMRATVNLTINMLADPAVWLPAQRRLPDESGDDWAWTLRSAPDRPILRVLGDGSVVLTSAGDEARRRHPMHARATINAGDTGYGEGGVHTVIALDRVAASGSDVVLQADLGVPQQELALGPSGEMTAGYSHKGVFGDASRMALTYASHPEMQSADGSDGMQWMRLASAEKMPLGDLAELEAGGTVYAIKANGYALSTKPFLRVTVHPGQVWAVRYRLATSRNVQAFDALDSFSGDTPVAATLNGRLTMESGLHQEISVTRKAGSGLVRMVVYRDEMTQPAVSGTGASGGEQTAGTAAVVDAETGGLKVLGAGYSANGVNVAMAEPIAGEFWGSLEYASGRGLAAGPDGQTLAAGTAGMHPVSANAMTASLAGGVRYTRTKVSASYRWQPHSVVTPVNAYGAGADQAYLSFVVHQAISLGNLLPQGLEATVDVTNLLAEGYHPFLAADGRTLYLAQAPRTVRAGLAFNF